MTQDPVAHSALGQLRDILQRYLQVVDVVGAAIDALEEQAEPQSETTGPPPQQLHEARASFEQGPELHTVLALQQRLTEVFGVATVTLEVSADRGYRFLVEMANPAYRGPSGGLC